MELEERQPLGWVGVYLSSGADTSQFARRNAIMLVALFPLEVLNEEVDCNSDGDQEEENSEKDDGDETSGRETLLVWRQDASIRSVRPREDRGSTRW